MMSISAHVSTTSTMAVLTRSVLPVLLLLCGGSAGVEERSDDVSLSALQTLVQQQASVIDSMQAQLSALRSEVDSMKPKVDANSKSVVFSVRLASSHDIGGVGLALGHHQTVVFDSVITNAGNGYNSHDGIFLAPYSGTYSFFLQMMGSDTHGPVQLAIVKNGNVLDILYADGGTSDIHDQGSSQVTTHLTAGDHVWVRQHGGDAVRASYWTIFTGYLLHAD